MPINTETIASIDTIFCIVIYRVHQVLFMAWAPPGFLAEVRAKIKKVPQERVQGGGIPCPAEGSEGSS